MKKILISLLIAFSLFTNTNKTHAAMAVMDFATEAATAVSAVANVISSAAEAAFTSSWIGKLSLDTIANTAKRLAVKNISENITNWANGGFQGDPTFVVNPDVYFKNIKTEATRIGLAEITKEGGNIFSDSAVKSVISDFRREQLPINEQIPFTLGSSILDNICNDANLSQMARNAVADSFNNTNYTAKKAELANSLCSGNASTDKNTQQAMVNIYKSNFSAGGGWGSWLELTGGQNEYNISKQRQIAVANKAQEKEAQAKEEVKQGDGNIGIKKCIKYSETAVTEDGIADCVEYETETPGKLAASKIEESIAGQEETLRDAHGFTDMAGEILGGAIDGMIGDFINKGLSGMVKAVAGNNSSGKSGLNSNTAITLTSGTGVINNPNVSIDNFTPENTNKSTLLKTIDEAPKTIVKIESEYSTHMSYLVEYEQRLNSLSFCYRALKDSYPGFNDSGRIASGQSYISSALQKISAGKIKITNTLKDKNYDSVLSLVNRIRPIVAISTDPTKVQSAMQEFINGLNNKTIPYEGEEKVLRAELEGERAMTNYERSQNLNPRESECINMRQEAQNQLFTPF